MDNLENILRSLHNHIDKDFENLAQITSEKINAFEKEYTRAINHINFHAYIIERTASHKDLFSVELLLDSPSLKIVAIL